MKPLLVKLTRTRDGAPLAVIEGMPVAGAELQPAQLRALAELLLRVADDAERRKTTHRGRPMPDERRAYSA